MNELIHNNHNRETIRWKLLTGASVFALTACISSGTAANAEDTKPLIWIELGGQMDHLGGAPEIYSPKFFASAAPAVRAPMIEVQRPAPDSFGENGKIAFTPEGSDWIFSAAIRYGRSSASKHRHYETSHPTVPFTSRGTILAGAGIFRMALGDGQGGTSESHLLLDFQAGKDVGLGFLGKDGTSVVSAGVRIAQFTSKTNISLHARPIYESLPAFGSPGKYSFHSCYFQSNTALIQSRRNTHAVGPSISWDASLPFAGNASDMEITLDWGVNAAVLFGRERAHVHQETQGYYFKGIAGVVPKYTSSYVHTPPDQDRSRSVTIPSVGGFAGLSLKFPNAKVSIGYRYDTFLKAMDAGIDAAKKSDVAFNGPYASISIGLGD